MALHYHLPYGIYGGAHFASEKEIRRDLKLRGGKGLILGIHKGEYLRMDEPLSVLIYAPPGSGKTAGVIIPSLLSCGNSALVHDPKGELHDKTAGFRMRNRQRIIRFEPAAAVSAKWNPLGKEELPDSWRERVSYIDRIANNLVNTGKQGDDYWTREARSLFVFFALYLTHRDGETSLPGNTGEAEEGIPLVLSQEVMSLPAFETLVLMQNHFETPVRAKAAAWFKDGVMKKRVEGLLKRDTAP
jgi:type IV secretory pathway TraG/TraD family ATPase VirD4